MQTQRIWSVRDDWTCRAPQQYYWSIEHSERSHPQINKPNRPKHFNVEGRHGCGRREAESTSPAPKTWSGWVSSSNGSLISSDAGTCVSCYDSTFVSLVLFLRNTDTFSGHVPPSHLSSIRAIFTVDSMEFVTYHFTQCQVPSPEYDMDACMASFLGGEAWEMCWVLGRPKSYTQLSCKYFCLQ